MTINNVFIIHVHFPTEEVIDFVKNLQVDGFHITVANCGFLRRKLRNAGLVVKFLDESEINALEYIENHVSRVADPGKTVVVMDPPDLTMKGFERVKHLRSLATIALTKEIFLVTDLADMKKVSSRITGNAEDVAYLRRDITVKSLRLCANMDTTAADLIAECKFPLPMKHRVLLLGGGGREHAIAYTLSKSQRVKSIVVSPGNSGTALMGREDGPSACLVANIPAMTVQEVAGFAKDCGIDLVIVGPEQPLLEGVADALREQCISCFGPSAAAARIETSKVWAKDFMRRNGIPTAEYQTFADFEAARTYIESAQHRTVIKASGLAAGKGVVLPQSIEEATAAVWAMLVDGSLGSAGREVVVERFLQGEEISVLAFCDGITAVGMPPAQDHKRAQDGDRGPNTGGMGAYAPTPLISAKQYAQCMTIMQRTIDALAAEGMPFVGVLYGGFIVTERDGPLVLEFNCRFGDPEAQALLPLLESDLYRICELCTHGRLQPSDVAWRPHQVACTVVCAAQGYPDQPLQHSKCVDGLEQISHLGYGDALQVFHAGAKLAPMPVEAVFVSVGNGDPKRAATEDEAVVTSGGRVLAVTGIAGSLLDAVNIAYDGVKRISFSGMHYRTDIGKRALDRPLRLGVLGSTKGTSLQGVIEAIEEGTLNARIAMVISNKHEAGILTRASAHSLPHLFLPAAHKSRETYDAELIERFDAEGVDVVLMVGYMRIASPVFIEHYHNRCINVHPSLLPEFAGGMDLDVHTAVLKAGRMQSGCTVHIVTESLDAGPIVVQKVCSVDLPTETADTLKAKVQLLERIALVEAVQMYIDGSIRRRVLEPAVRMEHIQLVSEATPDLLRVAREDGMVTYRRAGVNIDAGEALVRAIKPFCRDTRRSGCWEGELGGFGALFDLAASGYAARDCVLVSGTDGVGTKLMIAQAAGQLHSIGIDLVAMCANDVLVQGAEPLFFLDYFSTGKLDVRQAAEVVRGIATGCKQAGAALVGGETAEMAGMYSPGEYDLAGFCVGAVHRAELLPRTLAIQEGDILIALRSSGVHSNGFSLVRRCVDMCALQWTDPPPYETHHLTLADALLEPTRIYVQDLLPIVRRRQIKAMAHITGGGLLDNLPRVLPTHLRAVLNVAMSGWTLPPVFRWLQQVAMLPIEEMLRIFNCGIGMVLVVDRALVPEVMAQLSVSSSEPFVLGTVRTMPAHYGREQALKLTETERQHEQVVLVGDLV